MKYFEDPYKDSEIPFELRSDAIKHFTTPRSVLIAFGDKLREISADIFVEATLDSISLNSNYIVTDLRFVSEAKALEKCKAILLRVNSSKRCEPTTRGTHRSETDLDNYPFEYVINNDGSYQKTN